jgi:hypothetical protein
MESTATYETESTGSTELALGLYVEGDGMDVNGLLRGTKI